MKLYPIKDLCMHSQTPLIAEAVPQAKAAIAEQKMKKAEAKAAKDEENKNRQ